MKNSLKFFGKMALCAALVCPMAVSCETHEPYDDSEIKEQIDMIINKLFELEEKMNNEIAALKDLLKGNLLISDVVTGSDGVTTVTLSDGKTLELLPKADLKSFVTYITSGGVDYWAYIDANGKKQYFLNEKGEAIPVLSETPEVITRDGESFLVVGGVEYPLSGNSVFSDYELITDEYTGEVYAVTFTFGEGMSFTVTVDGAAGFMFVRNDMIWGPVAISEQYVPNGMTAKVQYQAFGVVDYLLQVPDGWRVKPYEDAFLGNGFEIAAPSAEFVESGIAVGEGELKVMAVLQGGRAAVAKLDLTTKAFKEFGVSFGNANVKMNNGLNKYVYGVCETSSFDEEAVFAKAVEVMDMYDYPAGYGVEFFDLNNVPVSDIMQSEPVPGNSYTLWALPAFYDEVTSEYSLVEGTFVTSNFTYTTVEMEVVNQSSRDAKIDIEVRGAEAYYFGVSPKDWFLAEDVANMANFPDYYVPQTELIYSGSAFELAEVAAESGTQYVAWLVVVEEGKTYSAADVFTCEFATEDLQPGSAVKVVAEVVETSLDVAARLTSEGAEKIYYAFLKESDAKKYADDASRAAYLFESGWYMEAEYGVDVKASDFGIKMKPEMEVVLMALATDNEGKYSEILYQECTTKPLEYNDMTVTVTVALNSPEEMKLNVTVAGGEPVEYLYWIGKTSDNTWKSTNYLGGSAETAQKYMYLNATAPRFTDIAGKYPVVDGVISMTDHTPGVQYAIVIMAKDAAGLYSKAAELKFTPYARNIGTIVTESDPKWEQTRPSIEWIEERFTPQIGMMLGAYGFNITVSSGYTAYVLCASDEFFTEGNVDAKPMSVEEKILTIIAAADKSRDSERVVDQELYQEMGYPYGHEFYRYLHGDPNFGYAVLWASEAFHESVCGCVPVDEERSAWNGVKFVQKQVVVYNEGKPVQFVNSSAAGSKTEIVDRVFVVLQDLDGNCYQAYEWDVPMEYFVNAKY